MIIDYLNIGIKNLRRRKMRSWLTILGILISVSVVFVLISLSIGLKDSVEEQFKVFGTDKFFIEPKGQLGAPGTGGAVKLTLDDVDIIKKVRGIEEVIYYVAGTAEIEFNKIKRYSMSIGVEIRDIESFVEIGNYEAEQGTFLKKGDKSKIMVGNQFKDDDLFKKTIRTGDKLKINNEEFEVKTILSLIGNPIDDQMIILSFDDFKRIYNSGNRVDMIMVKIQSGQDIKKVSEEVNKKLLNHRGLDEKTKDFNISTPEEILESFSVVLSIITGFLISVAGISLIVGGIGITNTMYTSVLERTREIGVMKAIGAKNKDILLIFLIESGLLGLIGGIIGIFLGFILGKSIEVFVNINYGTGLLSISTPIYLILGCLIFAFLAGAVSGSWPAYRASKIKPIDALRYE